MPKLWKTKIAIWTDYDPAQQELEDLARDATTGSAICSKQEVIPVDDPESDPDYRVGGFFDLGSNEDEDEINPKTVDPEWAAIGRPKSASPGDPPGYTVAVAASGATRIPRTKTMSTDSKKPPTKRIYVTLAALTRVQWGAVVEVPADATEAQCEEVVEKLYDDIDGGEYDDDPDFWDKGTCYAEPYDGDMKTDYVAVFDEDGDLAEVTSTEDVVREDVEQWTVSQCMTWLDCTCGIDCNTIELAEDDVEGWRSRVYEELDLRSASGTSHEENQTESIEPCGSPILRYALFVGSPYDSDYFGWGAYHNSYAELADAVADGEKLAPQYRNGGAYHVVDLQAGMKVVDSR